MIEITDKRDCCGCGACVQVCPKQCIAMVEDGEGFAYPQIEATLCVDCVLCERVCPVINKGDAVAPKVVYAAKNKSEEIRLKSSSGGLFTLLAERVVSEGGVVFGAKFDENWRVVHAHADTVEGLAPFRGSKYVQSLIGNNYKSAEQFLKEGREVLFSGTPCQIAGLKRFLRREYDNLLTVEVVCHGVPSPKVWRDYLTDRIASVAEGGHNENSASQATITDISFRDKTNGWVDYGVRIDYSLRTSAEDDVAQSAGTSFSELTLHREDIFMKGFLKNLNLRPSCYRCAAREGRSGADIAIADYWGVQSVHDGFDDNKGVGLVVVNTAKGAACYNAVCGDVDHIVSDYNKALAFNPCITASVAEPKQRKDFWGLYDTYKMGTLGVLSRKINKPIVWLHRLWRRVGKTQTKKQ